MPEREGDDAQRPDPDRLLERLRDEEPARRRGRLKIFFGFAAGVGKTFAMLQEAQALRARGVEVVVGWVEPHGRAETEALLAGLEQLPPRAVAHRGVTLQELDLDAALARRPAVLLVDELAHTNAPGSRHARRWQDVEELRDAGIDVLTTLNVQHIETLNDAVASITGVTVRETLPDAVFEGADEVELIDLPADELIQRLREGKVYLAQMAEQAIRNFFRKPNLMALREMALRRTADRVNVQVLSARRAEEVDAPWATRERVLACVSHRPGAARVVRAGRRLASALRAPWIAATVDTPATQRLSPAARARLQETLRLAERLGAETVTLSGPAAADELLALARERNVTKVVAGAPRWPRWARALLPSATDRLLGGAGDVEVLVVPSGGEDGEDEERLVRELTAPDWSALRHATVAVGASSLAAWLMAALQLAEANLVMAYLLGVTWAAARHGRAAGVAASGLSVLVFDFCFVPPSFTFAVSDTQYLITFAVMLGIALVISTLTVRIREQVEASRERERRTGVLWMMSRHLSMTTGSVTLVHVALQQLAQLFGRDVAVLLPDAQGRLQPAPGAPAPFLAADSDRGVAEWVFRHAESAGAGTDTLPAAAALYLPLQASHGAVGVLAIRPPAGLHLQSPEQRQLLQTMANQIALALEREALAESEKAARVEAEAERLRSSLLASVSHDLRTPLAVIEGASSALLQDGAVSDPAARREMLASVHEQAVRLSRLIRNLLDMTRLESGSLQPQRDWHPVDELVGSALRQVEVALGRRPVVTRVPPELPLAHVDGVLVEQALINLLDNALKHAPGETPIEVAARVQDAPGGRELLLEVADRGPGLREQDLPRLFDKFWRGTAEGGGAGLGLAICRGIAEAHGGRIAAERRPGGGALFRIALPLGGEPPAPVAEPAEAPHA